jgi:hypothetical protein
MARYLSRESEPYGKWRGIPIYLTTILTVLLVVGFLASVALKRSPLLSSLMFTTPVVSWKGWLSVLSYPLVEPPQFFTPFLIMCFYQWSTGIETHLGRGPLVRLLLLLLLLPVAFFSALWLMGITGGTIAGSFIITVGLLVAFSTLYPNAEWWGWMPFKYLAFACILCASLISISDHDWFGVASLWLICAASFFYIRHAIDQEYDNRVPFAVRIRSWFRSKPKFRVVPRARKAEAARIREEYGDGDELDGEVDDLLEKIARNGIASLTTSERARLEQARENLLKKERK